MKSIYLAAPYSHKDPKVRDRRFEHVSMIAGNFMKQGYAVFSPISHSHPIAKHIGNSLSHSFWLKQDEYWMERCDELVVAKLPGWEDSFGVTYEIGFFAKHKKPITYLEV